MWRAGPHTTLMFPRLYTRCCTTITLWLVFTYPHSLPIHAILAYPRITGRHTLFVSYVTTVNKLLYHYHVMFTYPHSPPIHAILVYPRFTGKHTVRPLNKKNMTVNTLLHRALRIYTIPVNLHIPKNHTIIL